MKSSTGKTYTRDIIVRVIGDKPDNVYWEAVMIENEIKPQLDGNRLQFLLRDHDTLEVVKESEKEKGENE